MTDYSSYYHISELITRELIGTLSEAEKEELRLWCAGSAENQRLYEALRGGQLKAEHDLYTKNLRIDQAWEHVQVRMDEGNRYKISYHKSGFRYWKIVALLLLILTIGGGLLYHKNLKIGNEASVILAKTGGYKAFLFTQQGERICLQDSSIREIPLEQGIWIQNNGHRVTYPDTCLTGEKENEVFHILDVPRGGEYELTLADGTQVWLNSGSQLRYPVAFAASRRKVYLKGEGYFQVHRDSLRPFIVETAGDLNIEVLGTEFNVQAYPDEEEIYTTVNTGSVKVRNQQNEVVLRPDQQAIYQVGSRLLSTRVVNASRVSAWKEGQFIFENTNLETIMTRLGRWYDLEIFFANPEVRQYHFTGDLEKYEDFTTIFHLLEKVTKIRFQVKNNTVVIYAGR